ncbi:MAG TPA: hypothetical protein VKX46_06130 [Ktedonobacteraceae bacterium]|nr:hypothetical protein [Ktedonobacteraceae bacterium]
MVQMRGYLLGRLFALLAMQGVLEEAPERLFRLASTAPPQVLPKALAALIESGKEEVLYPLLGRLPLDAFDGPLNRREQGAFALGYAHERSGQPMPLVEEEHDGEEQDLTDRYEFRVDAQLKDWIKSNGGGSFIRDILRAERARSLQGRAGEHSVQQNEGG